MDKVVRFCIAMLNLIAVVLIMKIAGTPTNIGEIFLRLFLAIEYLITLIILMRSDNDENNRGKDDDVSNV